jgi:hypothetical protein
VARPLPALIAGPTRVTGAAFRTELPALVTGLALPLLVGGSWALAKWHNFLGGALGLFIPVAWYFASVLIVGLTDRRRGRTAQRQLNAIPLASTRPARGERVRIVGIARARSSTFLSALRREAIVARYFGSRRPHKRAKTEVHLWELHAVDFAVEQANGSHLRVELSQLQLLPHPPAPPRDPIAYRAQAFVDGPTGEAAGYASIYGEEVVAPGDIIEVVGTYDLLPDPQSAGSERGARLSPLLRGTADAPVYLRRVASEHRLDGAGFSP